MSKTTGYVRHLRTQQYVYVNERTGKYSLGDKAKASIFLDALSTARMLGENYTCEALRDKV